MVEMSGTGVRSKRSVLMLCNDRQIDRRILLQADSLEGDGWIVRILAMPLDTPVEDDPRVQRIGNGKQPVAAREGLVLSAYRLLRHRFSMNGAFMRLAKSLVWRFLVDHERFYLRLFMSEARSLVSDVVVAHDLPMLAVGRALAAEFKARLVYDSHELYSEQEFSRSQAQSWRRVEARHIGACDLVVTVNQSIAKELQQRYGLAEVAVIHNAERTFPLGERSWYLHEHFAIPRDHYVLLFQGGLSARRQLPEMVRAMRHLNRDDIHLVILGDGQLSLVLKRLIRRFRLGTRVHLHRAVPQRELLALSASADAGVIPYQAICLNNLYCTPNKLFEFISAGLPILASDLPELRRLVAGNAIGRVTDLSTDKKIAVAFDHFFANPELLKQWRLQLLSVRDRLSWQVEEQNLLALYERFK